MDEYTLHSGDNHSTVTVLHSHSSPSTPSSLTLTVHRLGREVSRAAVAVGPLDGPTLTRKTSTDVKLHGGTWSLTVQHQGPSGFLVEASRARLDDPHHGEKPPQVEVMFECGGKGGWFGLGHLMCQHWPLTRGMLEVGPLYPFDNGPTGVCTVVVPAFMGVGGLLVFVEEDDKACLHAGLNARVNVEGDTDEEDRVLTWGVGVANFDRKLLPSNDGADENWGDGLLRLQGRERYDGDRVRHPLSGWTSAVKPEVMEHKDNNTKLSVHLTATDHAKQAHEAFIRSIPWVPKKPPPICMMQFPIWTTWAKFKANVTQDDVLTFAKTIVKKGLPRSVMEIDDRWSIKYGDMEFDREKFPDPKGMVDTLHALGFCVTLWVIPFAERASDTIRKDADREQSFYVQNASGTTGFFDWWQPTKVAALDVTNEDACEWFLSKLDRLRSLYGIDGFKFDAGEPSFLPKDMVTMEKLNTPSDYTRYWVHRVASKYPLSEVRSGVHGCQSAPPMFRLFDRFSTWGHENGLRSVIPALLTSGILGFPFVLPDMIGGNAYDDEVPTFELMVRWVQLNAAMPAVQFSVPPWDFKDPCLSLFKDALRWRQEYFWPKIEDLIDPAAENGEMICRPMWYAEPECSDAVKISDQFLLGDNVVVAPIVCRGKRDRQVYLPKGRWRRVFLGKGPIEKAEVLRQGPIVLEKVTAEIDELPCFERC